LSRARNKLKQIIEGGIEEWKRKNTLMQLMK
jgi:hypothetical protein